MEIITYSSGVYEVFPTKHWDLLYGNAPTCSGGGGGGGWTIPLSWGGSKTSVFLYLKDAPVVFDADETSVDISIESGLDTETLKLLETHCNHLIEKYQRDTPGFPKGDITIRPLLIQPNPDYKPRLRLRFYREHPPFTTADETFCEASGGRGGRIPFTGIRRGGALTGRAKIQNLWISADGTKAFLNITLSSAQYSQRGKHKSTLGGTRASRETRCMLLDD